MTGRWEEVHAVELLQHVLGSSWTVEMHDDNSRPAMHDVWLTAPNGERTAVEVTQAMDGDYQALRIHMAREWHDDRLGGGWGVLVDRDANGRKVHRAVPPLLSRLEEMGVTGLYTDLADWQDPARRLSRTGTREPGDDAAIREVTDRLRQLRVLRVIQIRATVPGTIYGDVRGEPGGILPSDGDPLAEWIGPFLRDERPDVLSKLARTGAAKREAFVIVRTMVTTAPNDVVMVFWDRLTPMAAPDLPPEVTGVWVTSDFVSGTLYRWMSESGWDVFEKPPPQ